MENIYVEDKEIDERIDELAKQYGKDSDPESLKSNPNIRHYMTHKLKQDKVIAILVENAIEK